MNKKKKGIIVTTSVIAVLIIAICSAVYFNGKTENNGTTADNGITLDGNAQNTPVTQDTTLSDSIRIAGNPKISIPAGEKEVTLNLYNPEGNPCYFTFCLTLKDTGEVLYTSNAVEPGKYIGNATLTRALDAGEYEANIHITTNSLADNSSMNDANLETQLIVK